MSYIASLYLEIFHHNCETGQYLQAFNIIEHQTNPDDRYSSCDDLLKLRGYNAVRLTLYERLLQEWKPENEQEVLSFVDACKVYGDVLQFLDRREEALQNYQQALGFYREIGDRLGEANVLQEFGKLQDEPAQKLKYLQKAQNLYVQIADIYSQSRNLLFLADVHVVVENKDAALDSLHQAAELTASINYQPFIEYTQAKIAEISSVSLFSSKQKFKILF